MKRCAGNIIFMLLLWPVAIQAQTGVYIPQQGKVFFSGGGATIFSDLNNQGQLGVGRNAILNFKCHHWINAGASDITDEKGGHSSGGTIRFLTPDSGSLLQFITAGYNAASRMGPAFPNLTIANPSGVRLLSRSMKVRQRLDLAAGTLDVNGFILVVGDNNPGQITGYNDKNFIITGSASNGGFLLRERISAANGNVVFPVGTAAGHYTPAAIHYQGSLPDDFYVRVSDSVRAQLTNGEDLSPWSVNKTWQIGQLQHSGEAPVDITLQHDLNDEGAFFKAHRQTAYVSQYISGTWSIGYQQSAPGLGTLTTGAPLINGGVNTSTFQYTMSQAAYFTKLAGYDSTKNKTSLWFSAYRTDKDNVYVYWATNPEIGIRYFVVQRRLITETAFSSRDTLRSKAVNGSSFVNLNYNINDPNSYQGTSFYRLMMVDYNGNITYSNIVAVGGVPDNFGWTLWPNPSPGRFFVGISRPSAVREVMIWDVAGRLIHREPVNGRGVIEMNLYAKGTYAIGLAPMDGDHIQTKKLVVIGD